MFRDADRCEVFMEVVIVSKEHSASEMDKIDVLFTPSRLRQQCNQSWALALGSGDRPEKSSVEISQHITSRSQQKLTTCVLWSLHPRSKMSIP